MQSHDVFKIEDGAKLSRRERRVDWVGWIKRLRRVSTVVSVDSRYALNPPYKNRYAAGGEEFNPKRFKV